LQPSCWLVAGHGHGLMAAHGLIAILVLTALLIVVINFNVVACWTIGWLLDMDMECLLGCWLPWFYVLACFPSRLRELSICCNELIFMLHLFKLSCWLHENTVEMLLEFSAECVVLCILEKSVPSGRTGTERTGTKIHRFLLWKRTDRFLKFGNRNFIGTEEPIRSVRVEPNAQAYSRVWFEGHRHTDFSAVAFRSGDTASPNRFGLFVCMTCGPGC
jgi:hypothetical protein